VGSVTANEDLKEVVVVILSNNSQQNTETVSKTDVLDAGNPFNFIYTAFLPSYAPTVIFEKIDFLNVLWVFRGIIPFNSLCIMSIQRP